MHNIRTVHQRVMGHLWPIPYVPGTVPAMVSSRSGLRAGPIHWEFVVLLGGADSWDAPTWVSQPHLVSACVSDSGLGTEAESATVLIRDRHWYSCHVSLPLAWILSLAVQVALGSWTVASVKRVEYDRPFVPWGLSHWNSLQRTGPPSYEAAPG